MKKLLSILLFLALLLTLAPAGFAEEIRMVEPMENDAASVDAAQEIRDEPVDAEQDTHFSAEAEQSTVYVAPNEPATLTVIATSDLPDAITYQWYDNTGSKLEGETGSSFITPPVTTRLENYHCEVSDGYGTTIDVWFTVQLENHFSAEAVQSDVYVALNESATLEVRAVADDMTHIHYQWCGKNGLSIDGATDSSYTTEPIDTHTEYSCLVSDGYNYAQKISFHVYVDTELGIEEKEVNVYAAPNEQVLLKVNAASKYPDMITYRWTGDAGAENETGGSHLTEPITGYRLYCCEVSDGCGVSEKVYFRVYVDTHFTAEAVQTELVVAPNESATFEINAVSDEPGKISYHWYDAQWNLIEEATDCSSYTTPTVRGRWQYFCVITDGYDNRIEIRLSVRVENHLRAEADGILFVPYGESGVMQVNASADCLDNVCFKWYRAHRYYWNETDWAWQYINVPKIGDPSGAYPTGAITEPLLYICDVEDGFGNSARCMIHVYIDKHFHAEAVQTEISVAPNETAVLEIIADSDEPEKITYEWSGKYGPIDGATGSSFTTEPITEDTFYSCKVSDGFGYTELFEYKISTNLVCRVGDCTLSADRRFVPGVRLNVDSVSEETGRADFTVSSESDRAVLIAVKTADGYTVLPCATLEGGMHVFQLEITADTELVLVMKGDADLNGAVNMRDSLAIKKHSAGTAPLNGLAALAANADGNGSVNMRDGLAVKKQSAGTAMIAW